ncbi:hypothetical protein MRS76_03215 [Rhizobiaceae bacterium n13]|uniref:Uncharacterized protein n=1 Tax=Ferirhizobium litorale TaxID=2927786 RepID=A0AAE3U283_9HYPH|nr:hypothetical protein [Fererhizobium litorale]MDI7860955.1 hypothetical protein [Fererhizobium litorale]MDI7921103.1 hypothetical protein [Fererhizobium litorale]
MQMHKKLEFPADNDLFQKMLAALARRVASPWSHVASKSRELSNADTKFGVFRYEGDDWPKADLFLVCNRGNSSISNIVPRNYGSLTVREYNGILDLFFQRYLESVLRDSHINVKPSEGERSIGDWLTPSAEDHLRRFSLYANKSSGASHPADRKRWNDFIIACHRAHSDLPVHVLMDWLTSEGRWPETVASDLAGDFENAIELLQNYDLQK